MRQKRQFSRFARCANTLFRLEPLHSMAWRWPVAGTLTENDMSDLAVATSSSLNSRIRLG